MDMDSNTSLQTLTDPEIDAIAGGRSGRGGQNHGLIGNINLDINVEPIVAIGNLIVDGNISTGNAANNASSGNISLGNGWLGLL
jgi:hypothetical protein